MTDLRDALLVVDLQEAFFEAPRLAALRGEVVGATNDLIAAARSADVPVLLISTVHSRDRSTWTLTMLEDDQGYLFHGDEGTQVLHELDTEGTTRVEKTRDSAWFGTDLLLRLNNLGVDTVHIIGVSTTACIAQTARDAFANNVRVRIVEDAVADEREEHKDTVLGLLVEDRQAQLVTVAGLLERWGAAAES